MAYDEYELIPRPDQTQESFCGKATVRVYENGVKTLYSYCKPICTMINNFVINHYCCASQTTARHIKAFCGLTADEFDKFESVDYDSDFREEIECMSKRTVKEIEILERFDGMAELTKEQERFLTNDILPNYMFYDRKANLAHCSGCGEDIEFNQVKDVRQGKQITCPKCGRKATGRCLAYGHNFSDNGTGVIMSRFDNDVVVRYYDVCRSYVKDFRKPYGILDEVIRDVFHGDGKAELYDRKERWQMVNYVKTEYKGWHYAFHVKLLGDHIGLYTKNLDEVLKGTRYEHCQLKQFSENVKVSGNPWVYGNYLDKYEHTPMWEYIMKMGMYGFAGSLWEKMERDYYYQDEKIVDVKAKTLQEMLGITRMQLGELREHPDAPWTCLKYLRNGMSFDRYLAYRCKSFDEHQTLIDDFCAAFPIVSQNPAKLLKWRTENNIEDMGTYVDYIKMAKDIGLDMKSDFILYPKDLQKSHDMATKVYNEKKMEIQDTAMGKVAESMKERFAYRKKLLQIVVPATASAIANEGVTLHHCVGTYIDRVLKGETSILFLRKRNELGKPYFTMEVSNDGRIVQCRGQNNCGMDKDVTAFVKAFAKAKKLIPPYGIAA